MFTSKKVGVFALLLTLTALMACGGGSGGGDSTGTASYASGVWIDENANGIYDPYEDEVLWTSMAQSTGTGLNWVDADGDGICDYAGSQAGWNDASYGDWIDENGDGVCDNYPDRPQDGTGRGWRGGWR